MFCISANKQRREKNVNDTFKLLEIICFPLILNRSVNLQKQRENFYVQWKDCFVLLAIWLIVSPMIRLCMQFSYQICKYISLCVKYIILQLLIKLNMIKTLISWQRNVWIIGRYCKEAFLKYVTLIRTIKLSLGRTVKAD